MTPAVPDETTPQYESHYVRVVPASDGHYAAVCSLKDCDFEFVGSRTDAALEADLHAHPQRGDGSGGRTTGHPDRQRGRKTR